MDNFQLESQFSENNTIIGSQLHHIWANVPRNECKSSVIKTYWSDFQKPIYITLRLPNTLPMYKKKSLMSLFI
jgi:hypothetical protein